MKQKGGGEIPPPFLRKARMNTEQTLQELQLIREKRDYSDVLSKLNRIRRAFPEDRAVQLECAQLFLQIKKPDFAAYHFQVVNEIDNKTKNTQYFDVLLGLCRSLVMAGDIDKAKSIVTVLDEKKPNDPNVLGLLSRIALAQDQQDDASKLALRAYAADAENDEARFVYAVEQHRLGNNDQALRVLERNIDSAPPHPESIDKWLDILKKNEQWRYAKEKLLSYAKTYPDIIEFVYGLAVVCNTLGELEVAREFFNKSLDVSPNNSRIHFELGVLERVIGDISRSTELIEKSLSINPDNPGALRTLGSDYKYQVDDDLAKRLHLAAARLTDMSTQDQVHMHYALGKYFEDVVQLDTAFRHYAIAGRKRNLIDPFDIKVAEAQVQMLKRYVTRDLIQQTGQVGFESDKPIFVIGMPRSGTSLLEQILSSHGSVFGAGELKYITPVIENISVGKDGRILLGHKEPIFSKEMNATYRQRGEAYVKYVTDLAGGDYARVVDKMPGNFNFLGLIHAILPNAKIIHSRRHPVETCLSNYRINFAEGQLWSYNLVSLGKYYRLYWDLMNHWRAEFPGAFLDVRYEDNVFNLEGSSKRIMNYLELEWNPSLMDFHNNSRPVKTASLTQVRKPIYRTSTNRWRKYEKYLGPLLEELGDIVPEYEAEVAQLVE